MSSPFDLEGINSNASYDLSCISRLNFKVNSNNTYLTNLINSFDAPFKSTIASLNANSVINTSNTNYYRASEYPPILTSMNSYKLNVNVKDFGALGDGVKDDTTSIQNAIATLTNNSILYFPYGKYRVSDGFNIVNLTNITIRSDNAEIYYDTFLTNSLFTFNNVDFLYLCDGFLTITKPDNTLTAFTFTNCLTLKMINVFIDKFNTGINYSNNTESELFNYFHNVIFNSVSNGFVATSNACNIYINACQFRSNTIAIKMSKPLNITVINSSFSNNTLGIFLDGSGTTTNIDRSMLSNNSFIICGACGIFAKNIDGFLLCSNNIFTSTGNGSFTQPTNTTAQTKQFGIYIENSTNVCISDNQFNSCKIGLGLDGYENSTISNNQFNTIGGTTTENHIKEYGITGRNNSYNTVSFNLFLGNLKVATTESFDYFNTNTGTMCIFNNNFGTTTGQHGTASLYYMTANNGFNRYIGFKNNTLLDASVISVASTSTKATDQSTPLFIPPCLSGTSFEIHFINYSASVKTWIRFHTGTTPTAPTLLNANIVYNATEKAISSLNLSRLVFVPKSTAYGDWIIYV